MSEFKFIVHKAESAPPVSLELKPSDYLSKEEIEKEADAILNFLKISIPYPTYETVKLKIMQELLSKLIDELFEQARIELYKVGMVDTEKEVLMCYGRAQAYEDIATKLKKSIHT